VIVEDEENFDFVAHGDKICGVLVQSPDNFGQLHDYAPLFDKLDKKKIVKVLATDLLALCVAKTAKEMGADIALGSSQRFGVPLGYGGPSAAFIACADRFKRKLPGRIIGITKDDRGNTCYRMSLQTRE
jgi:glycine dehydrogenase